jgi:hypothetical protein
MRGPITLCILLIATVPLLPSNAKAVEGGDRPAPNGDLICGPRCVQEILGYYGRSSGSLEALILEIQGSGVDGEGATLSALSDALNRRGVHTFGGFATVDAAGDWPDPVLVHVGLGGRGGTPSGHYVVTARGADGSLLLFDGPRGARRIQPDELHRIETQATGAVLLTSLEPITDPARTLARSPQWVWWSIRLLTPLNAIGIVFLARSRVFVAVTRCSSAVSALIRKERRQP